MAPYRPRAAPGARRRAGLRAALVGGAGAAAVVTVVLAFAAHTPGALRPGGLPGGACGALAGLLVRRIGGARLRHRDRRGSRRAPHAPPAAAPAAPDRTDRAGVPTVTWLISCVMYDGGPPGPARLRASVLQVALPADAEGQLKASLARADAAPPR